MLNSVHKFPWICLYTERRYFENCFFVNILERSFPLAKSAEDPQKWHLARGRKRRKNKSSTSDLMWLKEKTHLVSATSFHPSVTFLSMLLIFLTKKPCAVWLEGWRSGLTEMSPFPMLPCWLPRCGPGVQGAGHHCPSHRTLSHRRGRTKTPATGAYSALRALAHLGVKVQLIEDVTPSPLTAPAGRGSPWSPSVDRTPQIIFC